MSIGAVAVAAGVASAAPITIHGDLANVVGDSGTNFKAILNYTPTGASTGTLTIAMTNTSLATTGGYLTAFVFNIDSMDNAAHAMLASTSDADFLDTGVENGAPFGTFMAGAGLTGKFEGGGAPSAGLAIGATENFSFNVFAADAMSLTSASFINGPNAFDFIARFRGLDSGGSSKVPVPTPATAALLGLAGLAGLRRRRA